MAAAIVVEDGTGLSTANSYISLADAKVYWDNHGYDYTTVSITDDAFTILLINSTKYLDDTYNSRWVGCRGSATQALDWPRSDAEYIDYLNYAIGSSTIPQEVKDAVCESAYADNAGTTLQPVDESDNLKAFSNKIGPIEEKKEFFDGSGTKRPEIAAVKGSVKRVVTPENQITLVRV